MPDRAKRPCRKPGCPATTRQRHGYCDAHASLARKDHRPSAAARGYDHTWATARAQFLSDNPHCIDCYRDGQLVKATHVDHDPPHRGDQRRFWDRHTWRPRCAHHHNQKTAREDGGFGNPIRTGEPVGISTPIPLMTVRPFRAGEVSGRVRGF